MPFLTQGKTNWKYILIVVILAVVVGGGILWWIWNNVFVEKPLSICGPSGKYYWINISNCDKSCLTAEDCKFTCGCGAINKRETCHTQGITYDCVDKEVKCENNICVVGEEKVKDKTADWKTYRNEEYGFEIKYPSNFFVKSEGFQPQEPVVFIISFADEQWKNKGVHNPAVYIYVIKTTLSSQEWLEENGTPISVFCGGPEEPCPKKSYLYYGVSNVKEVNINNTPVLQFQHYGVSGSNKSTLFKKEPDTLYKIDAHSSGIGIFPQDIYDQMLSTFRFLE